MFTANLLKSVIQECVILCAPLEAIEKQTETETERETHKNRETKTIRQRQRERHTKTERLRQSERKRERERETILSICNIHQIMQACNALVKMSSRNILSAIAQLLI